MCLYGFLRTLRSLCLQGLCSLKLSHYLSVLRSVWVRYIQIPLRRVCSPFYICLLLCLLALGIDPVLADTPTPTYEPLWQTPTPETPLNYDCPEGIPVGWGTVTPSPRWLLHCEKCITRDDYDFGEPPEGWPTPEPTEVPADAPPEGEFDNSDLYFWSGAIAINEGEPEVLDWEANIHAMSNLDDDYYYYATLGIDTYKVSTSSQQYSQSVKLRISNYYTQGVDIEFLSGSLEGEEYHIDAGPEDLVITLASGYSSKVMWSYAEEMTMLVIVDNPIGTQTNQVIMGLEVTLDDFYGAEQGGTVTYQYDLEYSSGGGGTGGDSFCDEVESIDDADDDDFEIPFIGVGVANCYVLGGFNIPLSWLDVFFPGSVDDVAIPSAEFCFIPLDFGNLSIFGIQIDLDWIASAMAAVVLFRLITRS